MSSFCGFTGKGENTILQNMLESMKHDSTYESACFSDGFIHLGFVPYRQREKDNIGHNANFTKWVMVDTAYNHEMYTPQNILKAYEEKGISFVKELEGAFAIALWDGTYKKLYLIRDRYGARPLFYTKIKDGIVFGSELTTILFHNGVERRLNLSALYQYLSYQSILLPNTAYEDIFHISAGSYVTYADGKIEEICYSKLPFGECVEDSYEDAVQKLTGLLETSVSECVDEEMGVFLSGGVDSSLLTALAGEKKTKGQIRYAFCLEPHTEKESIHRKQEDVKFSKQIADKYGMQFYLWQMNAEDCRDWVDRVLTSFGQPFSGTMSGYFLANKVKHICNNIMTGDGADELFGGYGYHSVLLPLEKYISCKKQGLSLYGREKEFVPYESQMQYLDNLCHYAGEDDTLVYYRLLQMGDAEKEIFLNPDAFGKFVEEKYTLKDLVYKSSKLKSQGRLNRCLERDFLYTLPGHTLLYADTLSRNAGVHIKMPYINDALTNYVATLPQEYKMRDGQIKAILKSVAKNFLPQELIMRRKEPFSLPINEWLKKDLKEYVTDILSPASVKKHGLLNEVCVEYALKEFYSQPEKKAYYGAMIWSMAMLERWFSLYM